MSITITRAVYNKLYESWCLHHSVQRAALDAKVNPHTAIKYIHRGDPKAGFEAIDILERRKAAQQRDVIDKERERTLLAHRQVVLSLLNQTMQTLKKGLSIALDGVLLQDGSVQLDQQGFGSLVKTLRTLYDYGDAVQRAALGLPGANQSVTQVETNLQVVQGRAAAVVSQFMQEDPQTHVRLIRDADETGVIEALAAEGRSGDGGAAGQDRDTALEEDLFDLD